VRDVLYVEDLVRAFLLAHEHVGSISGRAFNMGGGSANAVSIMEVLGQIEELTGMRTPISFDAWRVGDQRYYVSDTRRFSEATGWRAVVSPRVGIGRLHKWLTDATAVPTLKATPSMEARP